MTRKDRSLPRHSPSSNPLLAAGIVLAAGFAALDIAGCDGSERVAGVSTETTNGLTGTLRDGSGNAVAAGRIGIWDARGDSLLGEGTSDAEGRWVVPGIVAPIVGIQATTADGRSGAWVGGRATDRDASDTIALRVDALSSLSVRGRKLSRLAGTPWRALDGTFRAVPPGSYAVLSDTSSRSLPLGSIRLDPASSDSFLPVLDSGLLVEDFDDGDSTWIYGPVRDNSSRWFTQVSPSGAALLKPLSAEGTATPGMVATGAWRGRSLRIGYYSADTGSFAQAGMYFRGFLDLSSLRSIRIRAKGDGILRLALHGYGAGGTRALWQATPDSTWKEFVFRPGEELPAGQSDPPRSLFEPIKARIFLLMIQAYGGSELWVDDIRFDGIRPETCLP